MTEKTEQQTRFGLTGFEPTPKGEHVPLFGNLPELVSISRAADALGVCEKTVRREISEGRLGCIHIGRSVRITRNQLEAYVASAQLRS
ncbi:MAG: helix-turn-helix domain-containing protein [Eggerthellaceae bacterium]|nr:helix-turn-helix domain-containing protein [Eggerthellaceae bacterium]